MNKLTESNITLNFPDANWFRWADCMGYKQLSGFYFKEMDACWIDIANDTIWLFELKDLSTAAPLQDWVDELAKKSIDSLAMLLATRHTYLYAIQHLQPCVKVQVTNTTKFKFVTIIHCQPSQKAGIQDLHNAFRNKFKPYALLFNIETFAVMEHTQAMRMTWLPSGLVS